jgi:hypothetical protein
MSPRDVRSPSSATSASAATASEINTVDLQVPTKSPPAPQPKSAACETDPVKRSSSARLLAAAIAIASRRRDEFCARRPHEDHHLTRGLGLNRLVKILPRISVGGISMVSSVVCRRAVVDGSLDLSARATCFFI